MSGDDNPTCQEDNVTLIYINIYCRLSTGLAKFQFLSHSAQKRMCRMWDGCVRACCVFSFTHLPISQVCAPCPPPVDTAPAHHWDHNCRLLKDRAGLSHYERNAQHSVATVNKEKVAVASLTDDFCSSSRSSWVRKKVRKKIAFSITHKGESVSFFSVLDQGVCSLSLEKETNSPTWCRTWTREQRGSWSLIYSLCYGRLCVCAGGLCDSHHFDDS